MKTIQRLRNYLPGSALLARLQPFLLLGISILAFGVLLPKLGFYWDDWPTIYLTKTHGNFWQYYQSDRPFMAWLDQLFGLLAGVNPLKWQLLAFAVRVATSFSFWGCLRLLWPKAGSQAFQRGDIIFHIPCIHPTAPGRYV